MENASKALLIAGGMMLAMLVVSLLIYGWSSYSDYNIHKDELKDIEDLAKFNEQFENYNRQDLMGYELISLANKIVDYNERHSLEGKNDEKYTPIKLVINLGADVSAFAFEVNNNKLFSNNKKEYEQSKTVNEIESFIKTAMQIENLYGNSDRAAKLAKNINSLTPSSSYYDYYRNQGLDEDQIKDKVLATYNQIMGTDEKNYDNISNLLGGPDGDKIRQYYEFYQFKKAEFKCTEVKNDPSSGRISYMRFEFTGDIE